MTSVILPPLSDPSALSKSGLPSQRPDARYNFLAQSILNSLGENGGISLVVADSSVESGFLRETLEQIHGRLSVFEVPCRHAMAGERIISSLPEFISGASSAPRALAPPGNTGKGIERRHAPMLFICDGAEGLEDEQIETMYSLSRGRHGPLGVVLLAKPEFLLRMQNSRLNHVRAALSACFWSQQSSYGAVCAADGEDQSDGVMPLNPAQLPSPLLERLTTQRKQAAPEAHDFSTLRRSGAPAGGSRFAHIWRYRRAIDIAFSISYLLVGAGTAAGLWWVSSHPQTVIGGKAPAPVALSASLPPPAPEGAGSAVPPTAVALPILPAPSPAAKSAPAAPAIQLPAITPEKSAPSVQAAAEPPRHPEEAAPLAPEKAAEKPAPVTSAAVGVPAKPGAPAPETLSDADRTLFAQRGSELLAAGDIASARLFFERAANAGDARSALGMAMTFDPVELAKAGVRGVKGDQAKAEYWYQRARVLAGTGTSGIK